MNPPRQPHHRYASFSLPHLFRRLLPPDFEALQDLAAQEFLHLSPSGHSRMGSLLARCRQRERVPYSRRR